MTHRQQLLAATQVHTRSGRCKVSTVFISYSHFDQAIAQRVYWRLQAYGIDAWLDEHGLRDGDALSHTLQARIAESETVVVIATANAVTSEWVSREVAFAEACDPPRRIVPFLIEAVQTEPQFRDHRGIDATDPHAVEGMVRRLADSVHDKTRPSLDIPVLSQCLQELARGAAAVAPLINGCLHGDGLARSDADGVSGAPFHTLDFALNALYDVAATHQLFAVASAAALLFSRTGAGSYTLLQYVAAHRELDGVMRSAVGGKLKAREHGTALELLASCAAAQDDALRSFIEINGAELSEVQQAAVVRLVLNPPRAPRASADEAAFAAFQRFPGRPDLRLLWSRWIVDGRFDALSEFEGSPEALADYVVMANKHQLAGWSGVNDALVVHVRLLVSAKDRTRIEAGIQHLRAHADAESPLWPLLFEACQLGMSKWDGWSDEQQMGIFVRTYLDAAMNDRNWRQAFTEYEETWALLQRRAANRSTGT